MDKNPLNFLHHKSFLMLKSWFVIFLIFVFAICSCSNSKPEISLVEAKVVYDFQDNENKPVQKLSLFVKLTSDVRRVESINVLNEETGFRWIILEPLRSQVGSNFYAGSANLFSYQSDGIIPSGKYTVCYMDSAGNEEFSSFNIVEDKKFVDVKLNDFIELLKNENSTMTIALYSKEDVLLYYGSPKQEWKVLKDYSSYDSKKIFSYNQNVEYFRVYYKIGNKVFVMPKVQKSKSNSPVENKSTTNEIQ